MADEFVNIGFSDITNVVLNNVKPERWEIGVRLVTYKEVKSIIDVVDDNNLPNSKITDSLATLLGNYIYNKVQKVSNFRKKIVRFVTRHAKDVEKLNSLVLELADKSPDSDVIGPFCTKLSITKTVLDKVGSSPLSLQLTNGSVIELDTFLSKTNGKLGQLKSWITNLAGRYNLYDFADATFNLNIIALKDRKAKLLKSGRVIITNLVAPKHSLLF